MKKNIESPTLALVRSALAPTLGLLRDEYERQLMKQKAEVFQTLEKDGWDAEKSFAYPRSSYISKVDYLLQASRHKLCEQLTESTAKFGRGFNQPNPRKPRFGIDFKLARQAEEMSIAALEGFACKMSGKIDLEAAKTHSTVATVTYQGGLDPWGYSHIKVALNDRTQWWRTRMIINVSCLGKLFNQWPTRLVQL